VAAEIRRGKKIEDGRKIEITGQKYNGPLLHRAAIKGLPKVMHRQSRSVKKYLGNGARFLLFDRPYITSY